MSLTHEDPTLTITDTRSREDRTTILCADVAGSTRLYEQHGDRTAQADIARCLGILARVSARRGGRVVNTMGDEMMCAFDDPASAAVTAGDMQSALRDASRARAFHTGTLRIKVGWHHGKVAWVARGDPLGDPLGEAPVIARQVTGLAKPEEILTSGASLITLPAALRRGGRLIDRVRAQVGGMPLDVYAMPWDDTEEITQVGPASAVDATLQPAAMLLEYMGRILTVDAQHPRLRVGRAPDSDLTVGGPFASRRHAEIIYRPGGVRLRDNSTNGCLVITGGNNRRVTHVHREEVRLPEHGAICLGLATDAVTGKAIRFRARRR